MDKAEDPIICELTICSLNLLGFNSGDYSERYPGVSFGIAPLMVNTFDKPNEKTLFVVLHFLLNMIDGESFRAMIKSCWPYADMKGKNDFKKALQTCLDNLAEKGLIQAFCAKPIVLCQAKGLAVWELLRSLTDACLDHAISTMQAEDGELTLSLSEYEEAESNNEIIRCIDSEMRLFHSLLDDLVKRQGTQAEYMEELEQRFKKATRSVEISKRKIQQLVRLEGHQILSESGRLQRAEWISKLTNSKDLLKSLSESVLLVKSAELVELDRAQVESGTLPVLRIGGTQNPERVAKIIARGNADPNGQQRTLEDAIDGLIQQIVEIPVV